jgi:hypothetical protein
LKKGPHRAGPFSIGQPPVPNFRDGNFGVTPGKDFDAEFPFPNADLFALVRAAKHAFADP